MCSNDSACSALQALLLDRPAPRFAVRSHFYCRSAPFYAPVFVAVASKAMCRYTSTCFCVETTKLRCQIDTIEHIYTKLDIQKPSDTIIIKIQRIIISVYVVHNGYGPMHAVAYLHLMRQIYLTGGLFVVAVVAVVIGRHRAIVVAVTPKTKRTNC